MSFTPGTKVLLATGAAVSIASLKPGDKVLATNTRTGKTQAEPVAAVLVHHDTNRYDLTLKSKRGTAVIQTTSTHLFWDSVTRQWDKAAALPHGGRLRTLRGGTATVIGGYAPKNTYGWMWDLTVTGDHDFYVDVDTTAVLVHNCPSPEDAEAANDPAASRPYLRVSTKRAIMEAAPKTPEGDFIDPNTGQMIPKTGPFQIGHAPGFEWWRTQQLARDEGWTREQLIEYENDPSHYQIEDPGSNMSRRYEMP